MVPRTSLTVFFSFFMFIPSHNSAAMWCFHKVLGLAHQPLECCFAGHESQAYDAFITWHVIQCLVNGSIRGEISAAMTVRSWDGPEGASSSFNLQPQVTHRADNWTVSAAELESHPKVFSFCLDSARIHLLQRVNAWGVFVWKHHQKQQNR